MRKIFISHCAGDEFSARIRNRLFDRLKVLEDVQPLLDYRCIEPADRWRAKILSWLRYCDAAIILFSQKALSESRWVRFETMILAWRLAVTGSPLIVPVLLHG